MATADRRIAPGSAQGWALALASVASFMVVLDLLVVATALSAAPPVSARPHAQEPRPIPSELSEVKP